MIGHEHVHAQAEAIHPLGEQLQEVVAVTVVAEGEALFIARAPSSDTTDCGRSGRRRQVKCRLFKVDPTTGPSWRGFCAVLRGFCVARFSAQAYLLSEP